jgi:protein-S-isoprenylcysteine O-methyltransferase Ste14
LWAVGTQIMLMNFVSGAFFIVTSWHFFNGRIKIEEELLHDFFGE